MKHELTPEDHAAGGRAAGQSRRKQTARQMAQEATTVAVQRLLENPPDLTDEQRRRLRQLLGLGL